MAAPPSERDMERRMEQMRMQDGYKGSMGSPQRRQSPSQPYKNGLPTFTPVIYPNPGADDSDSDGEDLPPPPPAPAVSATVVVQSQGFPPPPPPSSGIAGYNAPPPGTVCQATSRTMHDGFPPPPQSRDYENLPPGPRVVRQSSQGDAPYPYRERVGSPIHQQGGPHGREPRSPPSVRQEMQNIPDSPTHLYPSRSSLDSSPYRYDPTHSQYQQPGYRDPQREAPPMGYQSQHSYEDPYGHHDANQDHGPSHQDIYAQPHSSAPPHHNYSSSSATSSQPIYATPEPRQYRNQNHPSSGQPTPQISPYAASSQQVASGVAYGAPHSAPTSIQLTPASATVTRTVPAAHSSVKFRANDQVPPTGNVPSGPRGSAPEKSSKEAEVDALTNLLLQNMEATKDPDYYGLCNKCHQIILGEDAGCTALDHVYHVTCFLCTQCEKSLKGCPFFAMEGNPYCEDCYLNTLEKCSVCSKPITDRILRATGKPYHPQCFTCVVCGKSLDGIPFTVDATNQIHCIEDFHRKFAPRCCVCRYPIMPEPGKEETVRVVAMDRSFHVGCYKCEDCGLVLSSETEGRGCYPLDDHLLCKSCNAKRIQAMTTKMTTEL